MKVEKQYMEELNEKPVKKTRRSSKKKSLEPKSIERIIEIDVDEEPVVIEDKQEQLVENKSIEKTVTHSYDDNKGLFTAENSDGEKLKMFMPEILPSEYCMLVRKFLNVNNGVSIGKYSVGTHSTIDYGKLDTVPEGSVECEHCYNIVSECGINVLESALKKLKRGGKCFVVDSSSNLENIVYNIKDVYVRFAGYGYKLFSHRYWYYNKNMSIALLIKG